MSPISYYDGYDDSSLTITYYETRRVIASSNGVTVTGGGRQQIYSVRYDSNEGCAKYKPVQKLPLTRRWVQQPESFKADLRKCLLREHGRENLPAKANVRFYVRHAKPAISYRQKRRNRITK